MTTWQIFGRLLPYLRPYAWRVSVGIIAGMLTGGSLYGVLHYVGEFRGGLMALVVGDGVAAGAGGEVVEGASEPERVEGGETDGALAGIERWCARIGVRAVRDDGTMTWQFVALAIVALPLLLTFKSVLTYVNRYYMRWVGARVVADLRDQLFEQLQGQSMGYFSNQDVGKMVSRCTNDTGMVAKAIANTVADLTRAPFEILGALVFVGIYAVREQALLPLALFVIVPVCMLPIVVLGRRVRRYSKRSLERVSELVTRMHESFTGIQVVKAFHTEAMEAERFRRSNRSYFKQLMKSVRASLLMTPLIQVSGAVCGAGFVVWCYASGIRLIDVVPMGLAAVLCYTPLKQLAKINTGLQRMSAAAERVFEVLDTDTALPEAENAVAVAELREALVFEGVGFAYESGDAKVVEGIDFVLPKGRLLAVVGPTGSGKSTLAALLARFYDPTEGRILLDGVDLREIEMASLRRLVGVVSQQTILFHDTVANNIRYGTPEATDAEVEEAARRAMAHEFIVEEPEGYRRVVGEKGVRLSGGQRQRIAIARAILRNPQILILDEATSALDTVTEQQVQAALASLMADRTVFAIAHRLSTIRDAHQILVMQAGRIVERGTHAELLEREGAYGELCRHQIT